MRSDDARRSMFIMSSTHQSSILPEGLLSERQDATSKSRLFFNGSDAYFLLSESGISHVVQVENQRYVRTRRIPTSPGCQENILKM